MISITLICMGSIKESYMSEAIEEYKKRITPFCNFKIIELKEQQNNDNTQQALEKEAALIEQKIPQKSKIISLCIEGKQLSSTDFGEYISKTTLDGTSSIVFIIGSSNGLSQRIKDKSHLCLSVSKMTFPHQLFRVILLEQIYRAFSIINNQKYHK